MRLTHNNSMKNKRNMKNIFKKEIRDWLKNKIPFYEKKLFKDKLTSWKEIEQLINCRPFVSNRRLRIPFGYTYNWHFQQWLSDVDTYPPSVLKRILKTHWFYLIDCSKISKKMNDVCKYLEDITDMPTDAHIFISNKPSKNFDNKSFGRHKDEQDNIIVCVEGSQKIALYKKDNPHEIEFEETFKPGDAIYIPAGRFHKVTGLEKRISISFAMIPNPTPHSKQEREWITLS